MLKIAGSEEQRSALIDGCLPVSLDFGDVEQSRYCNSQGVEIVGDDVLYDGFVDGEVFMDEEVPHGSAFTASPIIPISRRIADTAISECSPLSAGR